MQTRTPPMASFPPALKADTSLSSRSKQGSNQVLEKDQVNAVSFSRKTRARTRTRQQKIVSITTSQKQPPSKDQSSQDVKSLLVSYRKLKNTAKYHKLQIQSCSIDLLEQQSITEVKTSAMKEIPAYLSEYAAVFDE